MIKHFYFFTCLLIAHHSVTQPVNKNIITGIDSAFSNWIIKDGPGCVAAVVKNGDVIYSKGFGLANIEDNVANSPQSVYYLASLAKQFTGYATALLIRNNKIDTTADIHTYLPWLPLYGQKITVLHLLHHTSGLRDDFTLLPFTGFNLDGILSQGMALNLIKKQHSLNFLPGYKFAYCNTNYILLSEIIEQVSGQPFSAFIDSAIFKPLHMYSSRIAGGPGDVITNRANSYAGQPGQFGNVAHNIYTHGDGGMFSTAEDMAKWMLHICALPVTDSILYRIFTTPGKLNNGSAIAYAMGIIPDEYLHQQRLTHKGALAGYKNFMAIYPALATGIIILTNGDDGPKTNKAMEVIVKLLLPASDEPLKNDSVLRGPSTGLLNMAFTGSYLAHNGAKTTITIRNNEVYADEDVLIYAGKNLFTPINNPLVRYCFTKTLTGEKMTLQKAGTNPPVVYRKVLPVEKLNPGEFVGLYTTTELDFNFSITLKNGKLQLFNSRHGTHAITSMGANDLFTDLFFIDHLLAVRDANGKITGLEFASGDTAGLIFKKERL